MTDDESRGRDLPLSAHLFDHEPGPVPVIDYGHGLRPVLVVGVTGESLSMPMDELRGLFDGLGIEVVLLRGVMGMVVVYPTRSH